MWARCGRYLLGAVLFALLTATLSVSVIQALEVPSVPQDGPVLDLTNTLTAEQKNKINTLIVQERAATGNQIGVLMISSLEEEVLEDYSLEVARVWGIGTKERNNGVLLLVAKNDRKMRIEVGYGLEGALPDIRAARIIRDRIAPEFRQGHYYEGIRSGVQGIIIAIHGEVDPNLKPEASTAKRSLPLELIFFAIFFVPMWLSSILARTKSWWAGGVIGAFVGLLISLLFGFLMVGLASIIILTLLGMLLDKAVSSNYQRHKDAGVAPSWWAGGTHIGGGGGFGGFSGGGFGGGGSSGDW